MPGADSQEGSSTIVRKRIMPACLVLAWCLLAITSMAGTRGPDRPDQPSPGHPATTTSSAAATTTSAPAAVTSSTRAVLTSASAPAATTEITAARLAAQPAATWTVRPGDTLSAVAAALRIHGGWPALYAANRAAVGPNPSLIRPGTVLALPGAAGPARYTVTPGDSLSAVAAALGVPGGWQALYAANERAIGPDPDLISAGTVLTVPRPAIPAAAQRPEPQATPGPVRQAPTPAGSRPSGRPAAPGHLTVPAGGMPRWLQDVLLAAGVLAATVFIAEPAAAFARRRRDTARPGRTRPARNRRRDTARPDRLGPTSKTAGMAALGGLLAVGGLGAARDARRAARKAKIILADHERLIVTYCAADHAVYVLTPPGEDPRAVLRAARLVLPEQTYEDLAGHLGVPSGWPLE
jgi:LysM repeat protein